MCPDEDGSIPPCSVTSDLRTLEEWEKRKNHEQRLKPWKERKAPCSCRYFDGELPAEHVCYIPVKQSRWNKLQRFITFKVKKLTKNISCVRST